MGLYTLQAHRLHKFREPVLPHLRGALVHRTLTTVSGFERAFTDFGLPAAIRTDNGFPLSLCGSRPRFDTFVERSDRERPHQGLGMRVPADVYTLSPRPYRGPGTIDYPLHD